MNSQNPNHPMSQIAAQNATKFIAAIIWKLRKHCPNLAVEITIKDLEELATVFCSNGQHGNVACIGKKDRIVLQLIDDDTGKMLLADPTGNEHSKVAQEMRLMLEARAAAPRLANRLRHDADVGAIRSDLAYEAAGVLERLTWEPPE
jgi:hypothetical protein